MRGLLEEFEHKHPRSVVLSRQNGLLFWVSTIILLLILPAIVIAQETTLPDEARVALDSAYYDHGLTPVSLAELASLCVHGAFGLIGGLAGMLLFTPDGKTDAIAIRLLIAKWFVSGLMAVGFAPLCIDVTVEWGHFTRGLSLLIAWSSAWGMCGTWLVHVLVKPIVEEGLKPAVMGIIRRWAERLGAAKK